MTHHNPSTKQRADWRNLLSALKHLDTPLIYNILWLHASN